ncbi:hypothetical protein Val02_88430 [Virgisporangium aliadipatigenens]|uniref:Uncharacterized protein n=1 Tax=Virgisporangium aliadipatigenens TaxID=741659 RepID=A0A8J4DXC5_9ACTN|nr:hypothetical protein [Virgisporangium aliadipatigenens]GIJ51957.1 hypothetical protein Val02_88430 [Virgisporangium aliadipatigenens]
MKRMLPVLIALGAALIGMLSLLPQPSAEPVLDSAERVILVGAPGLRWDDVSPVETPTLWAFARKGSVGALTVRSGRSPTCPVDGWLTLGAGNYARGGPDPVDGVCPLTYPTLVRTDAGAKLDKSEHDAIVEDNKEHTAGVELGALSESARCTAAVGPGAAVAAARPFGRIDRYAPEAGPGMRELLDACVLSFVDLGTIDGEGTERIVAARQADAVLAAVLATRPERSLVIVAGLSDTGDASRLHVVVAQGPGFGPGWLSSPSTGREGYVRLIDLAPTALRALGRPVPGQLFVGAAANPSAGRPTDVDDAVGRLADADRLAGAQRRVSTLFFAGLTVAQLVLFVLVFLMLRRDTVDERVCWALTAAAVAVPAAMVTDIVPWWRASRPGLSFVLIFAAVLGLVTAATVRLTRGSGALGPLGGVTGAVAFAVGVDVLTGARLQLDGVTGYSALAGGRYTGIGTIGLGVFVGAVLFAAASVAQRVGRSWRPVVVAVIGTVAVVTVGSPHFGADAGGAVGFTAGVCVAAAMSSGGWLTGRRLSWAVVAASALTVAFALIDLNRPVDRRGSVGRFLAHIGDGTSGLVVNRNGASSVVTTLTSPLTLLVIGGVAFLWLAQVRAWGGLRRVFGLFPAVRGAFAGTVVASLLAGVVDGVGLNVLGAALAVVLPLTVLALLRVRIGTTPDRPIRERLPV